MFLKIVKVFKYLPVKFADVLFSSANLTNVMSRMGKGQIHQYTLIMFP